MRSSAAGDRRLSPGSAARLAREDDDDGVRHAAAKNPVLPPDVLVSLLLDGRSAAGAAENPAIPAAVMHRMTTLAVASLGP